MVQSYSPGGANVPSREGTLAVPGEYNWTCAFFGPPESTTQTANRSVQPFLHSSQQKVPILYNGRPFSRNYPCHGGSEPHVIRNFKMAAICHLGFLTTGIFNSRYVRSENQPASLCKILWQSVKPFLLRYGNFSIFLWWVLDPDPIHESFGTSEPTT